MTSSSQQIASQSGELLDRVAVNLAKVPVSAIHRLTQSCGAFLADMDSHLEAMYDTVSDEEAILLQANLSPDVSRTALRTGWREGKAEIMSQFHTLRDELDDHFNIFEEMLEMMRQYGIPPNAVQADLPKRDGTAMGFPEDADAASARKPVALFTSSADGENMHKSPVRSPSRRKSSLEGAGIQENPETYLSPNSRRSSATVPEVTSPSGSRLVGLQSPQGTTYEGSMYAFTEIAIEDFVSWLRTARAFFQTIPRPDCMPGILDLTQDAVNSTFKCANGNVRSIYLKALTDPTEYIPSMEHSPDVVTLADIVFRSINTANVFDWFDRFSSESAEWEHSPSGTGKKRKRVLAELSPDTILKCRFVNALADLERVGMVKTRNGGTEVARSAYMWL